MASTGLRALREVLIYKGVPSAKGFIVKGTCILFFFTLLTPTILDLHVVYVSNKKAQRHSPGVPHANADTGGGSQAPATARFPSGCPAPPQRQPACRGATSESWAWTLWVYQVRDD